MKFTLTWLKKHLDTSASVQEVVDAMTMAGLEVEHVEDPAAKLAAFRNGDVDIMWDTVDNCAREASILHENNQQAKSILMQDWSSGSTTARRCRRTSCCSTCSRSPA